MRTVKLPEGYDSTLGVITPRRHFSEVLKCDRLLEDCRKQIERERETLHKEKNQVFQETRENGYQAGYNDGFSKFSEAVKAAMRARETEIVETIELVRNCLLRITQELPPEQLLESTLRTAFGAGVDGEELIVSVHPSRKSALEKMVSAKSTEDDQFPLIKVIDDPSLEEADCMLFTPSCITDISISSQIDELCAAISRDCGEMSGGELDGGSIDVA